MRLITLKLAAALVIAVPAYATTVPYTPDVQQSQLQDQTATGGQAEATGGTAEATGGSVEYSQRRQAPALSAPPVYASGPCAVGASGGISTPVGGISGGKVTFDADCNRRELARVLTPLNPALALKLLCADPMLAAIATESDCAYARPPETPAAAPVVVNVSAPPPAAPVACAAPEAVEKAFAKCVGK